MISYLTKKFWLIVTCKYNFMKRPVMVLHIRKTLALVSEKYKNVAQHNEL
jgi:hypothetical protein